MNRYKVEYTKFNNNDWEHQCGSVIVNAETEQEAREIVLDYSDYSYEYYVDKIEVLVE